MTEEIQDIERLIKQSAELADSLIMLARKLQEKNQKQVRVNEERWKNLRALDKTLTDLRSYIEVAKREIGPYWHYGQDEGHPKAHVAVLGGTATPPEAAIELLRAGVASKTITADAAAEQLAKLLDLSASQRIQIRQTVKAAFEAGNDVVSKIRPYLERSTQVTGQHARKTIAVTSDV
jgi:NADPH-dependent glutamate synthase beta subunit-like oxidoreductase